MADDDLMLATWLTESDGKLGMVRQFQMARVGDGQTLLRGRWDLVCIEMSSGKARRMPPEFLSAYNAALVTKSQ